MKKINSKIQKIALKLFNGIIVDEVSDDAAIFFKDDTFIYGDANKKLDLISDFLADSKLNGEQLNKSLFSIGDILNNKISDYQFYSAQITHYITSFIQTILHGENAPQDNITYIPNESLPNNFQSENKYMVRVILPYTKEEIFGKMLVVLNSGIALHDEMQKEYVDLLRAFGLNEGQKQELSNTKNREFRTHLYLNGILMPNGILEVIKFINILLSRDNNPLFVNTKRFFLNNWDIGERYKRNEKGFNVVDTDQPAVQVIKRVRQLFGSIPDKTHAKYCRRFDNFYISLKIMRVIPTSTINFIMNRLTKKVKPVYMIKNTLNEVSTENVTQKSLSMSNLTTTLRALAYCKHRIKLLKGKSCPLRSFKIRNGSTFTKDVSGKVDGTISVLEKNAEIIIKFLRDNYTVDYDVVKYPKDTAIGLALSAKDFIGNIPNNTRYNLRNSLDSDSKLVIGIYWENSWFDSRRVDLDLSLIINKTRVGWNTSRGGRGAGFSFSGDVVDAPHGAMEYMVVDLDETEPGIGTFNCNVFTKMVDNAKCRIVVARVSKSFKSSCDTNGKLYQNLSTDDLLFQADFHLDSRETSIATLNTNKGTLTINNTSIGNRQVASKADKEKFDIVDYYNSLYNNINSYSLNELLSDVFGLSEEAKVAKTSLADLKNGQPLKLEEEKKDLRVLDLSNLNNTSLDTYVSLLKPKASDTM